MNWKRHFAELASLVAAAVVCALVANALASPARKLDIVRSERVIPTRPPLPPAEASPTPASSAPPDAPVVPLVPPTPEPARIAKAAAPAAPAAAAAAPESEMRRRFPAHGQPWKEIHGEDVAWLHAKGALFLDARFEKIYAEGHVAGARSFPVWQPELLKARAETLVSEGRDGALPIVLYCSGGDCEDSHMLGEQLFGAGFTNLLVYKDGYPDWEKRGGATRRGLEP